MEYQGKNSTELPIAGAIQTAAPSGWKRYFRFPKSWKEVRTLGWKFVLAFVLFYLIRDSILYLLIPYLVYKGFLN